MRAGPLVSLLPRQESRYVSQSRTVLVTGLDGFVTEDEQGLFAHQTRMLSRWRYLLDEVPPEIVAQSNVEQHSWLGYYIALPPALRPGEVDRGSGRVPSAAQQTLEVRLSRTIGHGLHEDVDLTNFTLRPVSARLALEVAADFADYEEVAAERRQRGTVRAAWRERDGAWELVWEYRAEHTYDHGSERGTADLRRGAIVRVERSGSAPAYRDGRITFEVSLPPRGTWHACVKVLPVLDGEPLPVLYGCRALAGARNALEARRTAFLDRSTQFDAPGARGLAPVVIGALDQAERDLAALRLYDLDEGADRWTAAAGLPQFVALFGRDALTVAWQAGLASPDLLRGTPHQVARWQGTETNDWRDEQPGRMLHEAHTGPLGVLNHTPRARYYGSITTSGFYPVVVSELWHWTGDWDLVLPLVAPALRGLRWLDEHALRDGFYEYRTRSPQGVEHQAWKDSHDAIVRDDGSQVAPPIATCEEQGFVYIAKLHLAEVLWWLGRHDEARRLYREASELRARFNDAFWMDGYFAMGLDAERRQIRAIGSNPGHCIATGIVEQALVGATADRLMAADLFSGWGVRTLSADNPAYNPYSYHRGSVWPVEHGTFAIGLMRYGLHAHLERLCRAQFELASLFPFQRLPEVVSGHARDAEHPFPALYPKTNWPQAWSSAAVFCLVQGLLGLYPYAPLRALFVDPHLPAWLPELTLSNLRVGRAAATIRFFRRPDGASDYTVLDVRGPLRVVRQPSPWSLTASLGERLVDALTSALPGR